jgi:hypothetical protein
MSNYTAEQKIKYQILLNSIEREWVDDLELSESDLPNIDEIFAERKWEVWDMYSEFREGQVASNIDCDYYRHYESKSVAAKLWDGSWVGWTYWYGGGKHGEPEAIDWIEDAYFLDCVEEEKLVVVRTFTKSK